MCFSYIDYLSPLLDDLVVGLIMIILILNINSIQLVFDYLLLYYVYLSGLK